MLRNVTEQGSGGERCPGRCSCGPHIYTHTHCERISNWCDRKETMLAPSTGRASQQNPVGCTNKEGEPHDHH